MSLNPRRIVSVGRVAVVAAVLLAACDSVEERVAEHYQRGVDLLAEGEAAKATLEFRNALKLDDDHAPARLEIAKLYESDGELRAAVGNYRAVAELDPTEATSRIKLAQLMLVAGDLEEAARYSEEALQLAPEDPRALAAAAAVRYGQGEKNDAIELADRALALDPVQIEATIVRIRERMDAGDPQAALARVDAALEEAPEERALHAVKLVVLQRLGDDEGVDAQLRRMTSLYPDDESLKRTLAAWRLRREDYEGAEEILRTLAAKNPGDTELGLDLVRLAARRGGREAAEAELRELVEAAPNEAAQLAYKMALIDLTVETEESAEAIAALRDLMETTEDQEGLNTVRLKLAQLLVEEDPAEARELADAALAQDPTYVEALAFRGAMRLQAGETEPAVRDLRTAVAEAPDNPRMSVLLARAYQLDGSPDLAGERLAAAVQMSNYEPAYTVEYARFLASEDQTEAAERLLEEASRRRPEEALLLGALAEIRLRLEDWAGAEAAAGALAALGGSEAASARIRAAALGGQGRINDSIDVLRDLAEADGDEAALASLIVAYVRNGQIEQAEALVDERLNAAPDDARLLMLRAQLDLLRGDVEIAEERMRRMVETNPTNSAGYVALARLKLNMGETEEAVQLLRRSLEEASPSGPPRELLAGVLEMRQDWEGAIATYEALLEQNPGSLLFANNLASLLAEHRGDSESLAEAERIARRLRSSDVPHFQDTYGWIRYRQGQYGEALRSLVPAAEALPENPWVRFHVGMAFLKNDQPDLAREHLEAALQLGPDLPFAEEAKAALAEVETAAVQR